MTDKKAKELSVKQAETFLRDIYFTRDTITHAFFRMLKRHYPKFKPYLILEPGAGRGAHLIAALAYYPSILEAVGVDVIPWAVPDHPAIRYHVEDFLTWETDDHFDLITSNPPFSMWIPILEKSVALLNDNGIGAFLLRTSVLTTLRVEALAQHCQFRHIWGITPRPSFEHPLEINEKNNTCDFAEYAYLVFSRGSTGIITFDWINYKEIFRVND